MDATPVCTECQLMSARRAWREPGLLALTKCVTLPHSDCMAWYFRVIELADRGWACRRGSTEIDRHTRLQDAVAHITALASREVNADVFLHHFDGNIERFSDAVHPRDAEQSH